MSDRLQNQQIKDGFKKLGTQILNPSKKTTDEMEKYKHISMVNKSKISNKIPVLLRYRELGMRQNMDRLQIEL